MNKFSTSCCNKREYSRGVKLILMERLQENAKLFNVIDIQSDYLNKFLTKIYLLNTQTKRIMN